MVIAASFAVPVLLGVCIYVAQKFQCFFFCDVFAATSIISSVRPRTADEEKEDESSGESTKRETEGSNDSNVDKSDRKSIQGTDSANGQK